MGWRVQGGDGGDFGGETVLGGGEIPCLLKAEPGGWAVAAEFADAQRHFRGDGGAFGEDGVQGLAGDAEGERGAGDGETERGQHLLTQDFAGMGGRVGGAAGGQAGGAAPWHDVLGGWLSGSFRDRFRSRRFRARRR